MPDVLTLRDPEAIAMATHPVRAALLGVMRHPTSAAAAARATGQSRQNAAYHVRELAKVGLLRHAGARQNGNFVEQLYVAAAPTMVISPRSTWGQDARRPAAMASQLSLGKLVEAGEQLQRDAAALLDQAAFEGADIASASVAAEVRFATEADRAAFLQEYVEVVAELTRRHSAREGDPFRLMLAIYPDPEASHGT